MLSRTPEGSEENLCLIRRVILFLMGAAAFLTCYPLAADPRIRIVEPTPGFTAFPGQTIHFRVEVDGELLPGDVAVSGADDNKNLMGVTMSGPPYEGDLIVPLEASGPVEVDAMITAPGGGFKAASEPMTFMVIPQDLPIRLEAQKEINIGPDEVDIPNPLNSRLVVTGYFQNQVERDLSSADLGTAFTALTPATISVDSKGQIRPIAPGYGIVEIAHSGNKIYTVVIVRNSDGSRPGPVERTSSVTFSATGFRKDPETELFKQQVSIKNTGEIPLPLAPFVLITNLPPGVRLENARRSIYTAGGRVLPVNIGGQTVLGPGNAGVATLEFSNPNGVPITYSMKVFCGAHP